MCGWLKETPMSCGFEWDRRISVLIKAEALEKSFIPFLGSSNNFGSRNEEIDSMPIASFPPVHSTNDLVYK